MASTSLPESSASTVATGLGLAIGFEDGSRVDDSEKVFDFWVERSATRAHDADVSAEDFSHWSENKWIIDPVPEESVVMEIPFF